MSFPMKSMAKGKKALITRAKILKKNSLGFTERISRKKRGTVFKEEKLSFKLIFWGSKLALAMQGLKQIYHQVEIAANASRIND